jgi:hypothetical protein
MSAGGRTAITILHCILLMYVEDNWSKTDAFVLNSATPVLEQLVVVGGRVQWLPRVTEWPFITFTT